MNTQQKAQPRYITLENHPQELAAYIEAIGQLALISITDRSGRILQVNAKFCELCGYSEAELIGQDNRILNSGTHPKEFFAEMWATIERGDIWRREICNRNKVGQLYWVDSIIVPLKDADGQVTRYLSARIDITERKRAEVARKEYETLIWRQANFDPLTNLPNRRMFHDLLEQEMKKSDHSRLPLALLLFDLDHFRRINDTYGHAMGDMLLQDVARRLSNCIHESGTVMRLGGDEFVVILGKLDDPASVERITQDALRKLAAPFRLENEVAHISASVGITLYPADAGNSSALLKSADQAMYAAKRQGRNRYSYFTSTMQQAAQIRTQLINDLRAALANNELLVYYQPIVELATRSVHKAEALVRWQHPTRGLIDPAEFIPVAEDTGMVVDIGNWVFREAASQVASWRASHHAAFQISVNRSPVQFHSENNTHAWFDHLQKLGLPGQSIVVEITEGLLLDTNTAVTEQLLAFRDAGMQVSLDDFGTGYSALAYLKKFDIDYLKIDRSFVHNLAAGSNDMALCEAIIVMAHKLGLKVIAEGVETTQQRDLLTTAGCDYGQGHLFSRPVPSGQFEILLQTARQSI